MRYRCNWCGKEFSYNPTTAPAQIGQAKATLQFCSEDCYAQGKLVFELEFGALSEIEAVQFLVEKVVLRPP